MTRHFFYLARCSDGTLYAGSCIDVAAREARHNAGRGAKYTRSRRPVRVVYFEEFGTLAEARRRESEVKKWRKAEKERLVKGGGVWADDNQKNLGKGERQG